jgi:hypothetical protein
VLGGTPRELVRGATSHAAVDSQRGGELRLIQR